MRRSLANKLIIATAALIPWTCVLAGCGTTRSSDTTRTATEQLLISDAIDRAVQTVHLQTLAGQTVYLDDSRLGDVVDRNYLVSTLRQHLLASGCALRAERDQADFVVEARAGAIGTDRNDLLFGIPSMNVPQIFPVQPMAAAIPEIPFAKRRDQRGIAKIAVFAYHRETGTPVWQSGIAHEESSANDVWILGAGPFQRGTIYDGTAFAGKALKNDEDEEVAGAPARKAAVDLARESTFANPRQLAKQAAPPAAERAVVPAVHEEAAASAAPAAAIPTAPPNADPMRQSPLAGGAAQTMGAWPAAAPVPDTAELRRLLSGGVPAQAGADRSGITARLYEVQPARESGTLQGTSVFPKLVDPIPLPQPRFNSP